jgi:hypothetical protein
MTFMRFRNNITFTSTPLITNGNVKKRDCHFIKSFYLPLN